MPVDERRPVSLPRRASTQLQQPPPHRRNRLVRRSALPRSQTTSALPDTLNTPAMSSPHANTAIMTEASDDPLVSNNTASGVDSQNAPPPPPLYVPPSVPSQFPAQHVKSKKGWRGHLLSSRDRPASSPLLLPTSPIPQVPMSPKAAKLLGVEGVQLEGNVGTYQRVRRAFSRGFARTSSQKLTVTQSVDDLGLRSSSEVLSVSNTFDPTVAAASTHKRLGMMGRNKGTKAMRLMDLMPSRRGRSRSVERPRTAGSDNAWVSSFQDKHVQVEYGSTWGVDGQLSHPQPIVESVPAWKKSKRRRRKKKAKPLEHMSPIREATFSEEELTEDDNELDAVSEYNMSRKNSLELHRTRLRRSLSAPLDLETSMLQSAGYMVGSDDEPEQECDGPEARRLNRQIDMMKLLGTNADRSTTLTHGPLQRIEKMLLENQEKRIQMDHEMTDMYRNHLENKAAFEAMMARHAAENEQWFAEKAVLVRDPDTVEENLNEIGSNAQDEDPFDADGDGNGTFVDDVEEFEICEATLGFPEDRFAHTGPVMAFGPQTVGGPAKLVDIPPRKKDRIIEQASSVQPLRYPLPPQDVQPFQVRVPGRAIPIHIGSGLGRGRRHAQPMMVGRGQVQPLYINPGQATATQTSVAKVLLHPIDAQAAKLGIQPGHTDCMPSCYGENNEAYASPQSYDNAQLQSQDGLTVQRPPSEHSYSDVVVDQEQHREPAPPRKDSLPIPKHHCFQHGHLFHPISLKGNPLIAGIGRLSIPPRLTSQGGREVHINVPLMCSNCNEDVKGEVWRCELPACGLEVCRNCAVDMDSKSLNLAVESWGMNY